MLIRYESVIPFLRERINVFFFNVNFFSWVLFGHNGSKEEWTGEKLERWAVFIKGQNTCM